MSSHDAHSNAADINAVRHESQSNKSSAGPARQAPFIPMPQRGHDLSSVASTSALTPPIQQQESILSSLSAVAAAAAADAAATSDDEEGAQLTALGAHAYPSSSSSLSSGAAPVQERGNGWQLLSRAKSAARSSQRQSIQPSSSTSTPTAPTTFSPLNSSRSSVTQAHQSVPSPRSATDISEERAAAADMSVLNSVAPNGQVGSSSAWAIGCEIPSRSRQDSSASKHHHQHPPASSNTLQPSSSGRGSVPSMELPAEGAGLRGKDEDEIGFEPTQGLYMASKPEQRGATDSSKTSAVNPLEAPPARKLCIRHQRMADEGTVGKLQRSIESLPLADQTAVNTVWSTFSSSSHARRALILQGIISMSCFSQLSLLSSELALAIRIDPFCLFPREVSLKVLGHLDAMSLGKAAQVSKAWRALADDDLLWRNMCEQHIERKCEKCGWGLPLLSEKRRRVKGNTPTNGGGAAADSRQLMQSSGTGSTAGSGSPNAALGSGTASPSGPSTGNLKRSVTAAANAAALERHSKTAQNSRSSSPVHDSDPINSERPAKRAKTGAEDSGSVNTADGKSVSPTTAAAVAAAPTTRPWKSVYCERLAIERNWRRGRYTVRSLNGHTDGIMCLQFNESLSHPSFPVVITGSYDRTARIWNMDTGEELRVLRGHTRGVRCLQFDEAKLITGSMDRTLKIWNWRTGALIRTLEGHTEGIVCLNFNDHLLASGSADSNIKIWNFKTGQCCTLRGHTDWVNSVWLWSGNQSQQRPADSDGAEDTFLFSASDDGTIRLWDLALKECLMVYTGHVGQTQGLSLVHMPEEVVEQLATGGNAAAPAVSHAKRTAAAASQQEDQPSTADATYFTPGDDVSDQTTGTQGSTQNAQTCGYNPSSIPGGRSANTGTAPGIPDHFYNAAASGQHRSALRQLNDTHTRKIDPALMKLQQRLQAAGLVDSLPIDAEMGDLEWGAAKRAAQRSHRQPMSNSSGSGSSSLLNSVDIVGPDGASSSSSQRASPPSSSSNASHARLRPMLFSCSLDNTIKIWDVRTGVCIRTLFGHMAGLWALSTDRLRLATASHDSTLKIWELATGKHLFSICEHRGPVTCVQIGDDKVISGSDDGQVNIYGFNGGAAAAAAI